MTSSILTTTLHHSQKCTRMPPFQITPIQINGTCAAVSFISIRTSGKVWSITISPSREICEFGAAVADGREVWGQVSKTQSPRWKLLDAPGVLGVAERWAFCGPFWPVFHMSCQSLRTRKHLQLWRSIEEKQKLYIIILLYIQKTGLVALAISFQRKPDGGDPVLLMWKILQAPSFAIVLPSVNMRCEALLPALVWTCGRQLPFLSKM